MKQGLARLVKLAVFTASLLVATHNPVHAQSNPATATMQISLDQARGLARRAFQVGEYALANRLAHDLLKVNPKDVAALILLAATEPLMGRPEAGRRAGRSAWKITESTGLRHEIAFYTARAALFDKRFLETKFWLRRAWQSAADEDQRNRIAYDFSRVRAVSPWVGRLNVTLTPSTNLNGGSQWDWTLIDDTYIVGEHSGSAQALSGWRAAFGGELGYKISRTTTHETTLGFSAYHSFNFLSQDAKALAPEVSPGDLNFASLRLFADHRLTRADLPVFAPDHARLSFGQNWYGGAILGRFAALKLDRTFKWADGTTALNLSLGTRQDWDTAGRATSLNVHARGVYRHRFSGGSQLSLGLGVQNSSSDTFNNAFTQADIRLGYTFGQAIGPAHISFELGLRGRDYARFAVGPFVTPNGRQDAEISASLSFAFDEIDYLGFSPVISLNGARTISNITRYETISYGVSLGFKSTF